MMNKINAAAPVGSVEDDIEFGLLLGAVEQSSQDQDLHGEDPSVYDAAFKALVAYIDAMLAARAAPGVPATCDSCAELQLALQVWKNRALQLASRTNNDAAFTAAPSVPDDGIIQRGTFAGSNGFPSGWSFLAMGLSDGLVLRLENDGSVYLNGLLSEELTAERRAVMAAANEPAGLVVVAPDVPAPVAGNEQQQDATLTNEGTMPPFAAPASQRDALVSALRTAEAALADIGDADREPGDDVAWCEKRAADALPKVRAALATAEQITSAQVRGEQAPSQPPAGPSEVTRLDVMSLIRSQMHRSYTAGHEGGEIDPKYIVELEDAIMGIYHGRYIAGYDLRKSEDSHAIALAATPVIPPAAPSEDSHWWREMLAAVMRELPPNMGRYRDGNAPGHCHSIPGIWDSDNKGKAGTTCAWCLVWNKAKKEIDATVSRFSAQGGNTNGNSGENTALPGSAPAQTRDAA